MVVVDSCTAAYKLTPPAPQQLSRTLGCIIRRGNVQKHERETYHRMQKLIRCDAKRKAEYKLVMDFCRSQTNLHPIAFEYVFDDGVPKPGCGDLLLCDDNVTTLYVLEAKLVAKSGRFKRARKKKVQQQAVSYAQRLGSWAAHMAATDDSMKKISSCKIIPATLTDENRSTLSILNYADLSHVNVNDPEGFVVFCEHFAYYL